MLKKFFIFALFLSFFCGEARQAIHPDKMTIRERFEPPKGFVRSAYEEGSFAEYVRSLRLKKHNHPVYLYNGKLKHRQDVHLAVLDISVGEKDLQQCADAVMRIRSDYFYYNKHYSKIAFNITAGGRVYFSRYLKGERPYVSGRKLHWKQKQNKLQTSAEILQAYGDFLYFVYSWAGSYSLSREVKKVKVLREVRPGDMFIQGGFPGHAVLVADRVENMKTGEILVLLAQSYMPAQQIHILKNPARPSGWYSINHIIRSGELITPEWKFTKDDLGRFR